MKKIISLLLVAMLALSSAIAVNAEEIRDVFSAKAESTSARGDIPAGGVSRVWGSLSWTLTEDGVLTISGSGAMNDSGPSSYNQWKSYNYDITSVVIESGVTSIGSYVFAECRKIKSVVMPDTVKSIGDGAFFRCHALTDVKMPNALTSIGKKAFMECKVLKSIVIPDTVTFMGDSCFRYAKLESVNLPAGITSLPSGCFTGCPIKTIEIPGTFTTINNAFSSNSKLEKVILHEGTKTISNDAFYGCSSLTQINIPSTVTTIGASAFAYTGLHSVTIPSGVDTIESQTFYGCRYLESVTILGENVTIGEQAFSACSHLFSIDLSNVASIGKSAFDQCDSLTSVTIPGQITAIPDEAFRLCSSLREVIISEGVTSVGEYAFRDCVSLNKVTIPNSMETVGYGAFQGVLGYLDIYFDKNNTSVTLNSCILRSSKTTVIGTKGSTVEEYCERFNGDLNFAPYGTNHTVTLNANGGSFEGGTPGTLTKVIGQDLNIPYVPVRNGYVFVGWGLTSSDTITSVVATDTYKHESGSNVTLYAIWNREMLLSSDNDYVGNNDPVPGYESSKIGDKNDESQIWAKQSAKWIKSATGTAELRVDFAYNSDAMYQSRDVIFVIDVDSHVSYFLESTLGSVSSMISALLKEYDNCRVATVGFGSGLREHVDFTSDYNKAIAELAALKPQGGSDYAFGLRRAYELLENRADKSRDPLLVFVSPEPVYVGHKDANGIYGGTEAAAIKAAGCPIACVYVGQTTQFAFAQQQLGGISSSGSLIFNGSASSIFKNMFIALASRDYKVKINLDTQRFTTKATSPSGGSYGNSTISVSNNVITWDVSTLDVGTEYYFTIPLNLVSDPVSGGPRGASYTYPTSLEGNSIASIMNKSNDMVVNTIDTPVLTREDAPVHIILDHNGGTYSVDEFWFKTDGYAVYSDSECNTVIDEDGYFVRPTRTGYDFKGYKKDGTAYIDQDGWATDDMYTLPSETTLTAEWNPIGYQVVYNPNGSGVEGDTANSSHTYGVAKELTPNGYTRPGYTFSSWNTSPDGTGTKYFDKQSVINLTTEWADKVHLYAQWTPINIIHIILDHNGGTNSVDEFWFREGGSSRGDYAVYSDSACNTVIDEDGYFERPTRTGYEFKGYKIDGTAYIDQDGWATDDMYTLPSETTLTAEWTPLGYTVYYNPNGSGVEGSTANSSHTYDVAKELTPNGYTRPGYTFIEWNTSPDGTGTSYADKESVINLTTEWADRVHLYAQWKMYIKVTLDNQKATTPGTTPAIWYIYNSSTDVDGETLYYYTDSSCSTSLEGNAIENPTKTGYTFGGYYTETNGAGTQYIDSTGKCINDMYKTFTADTTLYAKWTPRTVKQTINANAGNWNGSIEDVVVTVAYGDSTYSDHSSRIPTRTSYTFDGFWDAPIGGTQIYTADGLCVKDTAYWDSNSCSIATEDYTIYAHWSPITYKVVYNGNADGVNGTTEDSIHEYNVEQQLTPNGFEREGYTFKNWNTKEDGTGTEYADAQVVENLTDKQDDVVNLYAQWTINTYTVVYNANGDGVEGSTATSTHTFDVAKELTANGFTRDGYTFTGWNTNEDGTGTSYTDKESVINLTTEADAEVNLYAQWEEVTYTLTANANGGSITTTTGWTGTGATATKTLGYGAAYGTLPTATRTGYTLKGWYTAASGGTEVTASTTMGNADTTIYAQWTPITYTVVYNGNGDGVEGSTATSTHEFDVAKELTANGFTREGYTFTGWNTNEDGTGTNYTDKQSVINLASTNGATVQLYAKWEAVPQKTSYIRYYDGSTLLQETAINDGETTHKLTETPIASAEEGLPVRNGYLFAGWYTTNLTLGTTTGGTAFPQTITIADYDDANGNLNLYAAWVSVGTVTKDGADKNSYGGSSLKGFSLEGVQIRSKEIADKFTSDYNTDQDALRFVTVYSNSMLEKLQSLNGKSVSYGYTAYAKSDIATKLTKLDKSTEGAKDVDCTKEGDQNHRMFDDYRLSTLVIKYDGADAAYKGDLVEARAYVDYTDANGFGRRGYHTYSDSKFAGGCRTSFNSAWTAVNNAYDALAKVA